MRLIIRCTTKQAQGYAGIVAGETVQVQSVCSYARLRELPVWGQIATDVDSFVEADEEVRNEVWAVYKYVNAAVAEEYGVNRYFALPRSIVDEILAW